MSKKKTVVTNSARDGYWDIVRGLGILAVVLGHAGIQGRFFSAYHLPLFFFISGHFYNDKHSKDIFVFFAKKLERLWWPAFKYTLFFIVFHNLFVSLYFIDGGVAYGSFLPGEYFTGNEIFRRSMLAFWGQHIEALAGPIWFIYPLIISLTTFAVLRKIVLGLPSRLAFFIELLSIIGLYALGIYIIEAKISVPFWTELAFLVVPIVYIGFITKDHIKKFLPQNIFLLLLGIAIPAWVINYCVRHQIIIILSEKKYYDPLIFLGVTLLGIVMNLCLAQIIHKVTVLNKLFAYMGQKSFHIMALHFLSFKLVNYLYIFIHHSPMPNMAQIVMSSRPKWWPLYVVVGIGVPLVLCFIYDSFKKKLLPLSRRSADHLI